MSLGRSAFVIAGSQGERAFLLARAKRFELHTSVAILTETAGVLRRKFGQDEGDRPVYAAVKDTGLRPGTVYHYMVRALEADGRWGPDSMKARTQPRVIEDAVVSVLSEREVALTWTPPEGNAR